MNKYRSCRVENPAIPGMWFDSKLERGLWYQLAMFERGGAIRGLKHHPGTVFLSEARIQYRPDFSFTNCKTGLKEFAEAKGFEQQKWASVKKLWRVYGAGVLYIYKGSEKYLKLTETITPGEKKK